MAAKTTPEQMEAREVLSQNLQALIDQTGMSPIKLAKLTGVGQRTIYHIVNKLHDPSVGRVNQLAGAFGLKAWQLMMPVEDLALYDLLSIYERTDDNSRRLIDMAAKAARRERSHHL